MKPREQHLSDLSLIFLKVTLRVNRSNKKKDLGGQSSAGDEPPLVPSNILAVHSKKVAPSIVMSSAIIHHPFGIAIIAGAAARDQGGGKKTAI